uniref:transposase n=1 Tax=Streptomyces olivochromogenes TaxID=1963 RepID=UPI0035AEB3EF
MATGHLALVAKCRRGVFDDEMLTRCEEIRREVCEDFEAELKEFNGRINHAIMDGHLRSPSYFSASCGGAPLAIVSQHIEQQKRPPTRVTRFGRRTATAADAPVRGPRRPGPGPLSVSGRTDPRAVR